MRLLTYNIHKGVGGRDRLYRIERILDVIESQNPDLVCLQEVVKGARRARHHDQPRLIADRLNATASVYQLNVRYQVGGYGNQLLSRWPFSEKHQISLRIQRKKPRGAQVAMVKSPEGPLRVVNWHLGLAEAERAEQVEHLFGHRFFRAQAGIPTLVAGDFNDWRNTLAEAFEGHDFEQVTAPPSRFRSFPAYLPVGSLDKCYRHGGVEVRDAFVVRTAAAKVASDHLPVVVDFHLR